MNVSEEILIAFLEYVIFVVVGRRFRFAVAFRIRGRNAFFFFSSFSFALIVSVFRAGRLVRRVGRRAPIAITTTR